MLPCFSYLSILLVMSGVTVADCSMTLKNINAASHDGSINAKDGHFFANTEKIFTKYGTMSAIPTRFIDRRYAQLINQYEKENTMKYINPEDDVSRSSPTIADLARKRNVMDMIIDDRRKLSKEDENKEKAFGKLFGKRENEVNSTSNFFISWYDFNERNTTKNPWPLVPGPISCDFDFQLEPSFVANLGEFEYVVSVQRQRNPNEPAEHVCTGVIYNPRFVIIPSHCLTENYGLTVTSTDDLCTIDEIIDVDYIIRHENYDSETRRNDIALIKLKSEIHKKAAKLAKDNDVPVGRIFYAVGFGELMWKSFPKRVGKLLQKVPVERYPRMIFKEAIGTLRVTTSHMDLTGAFRGDFGGALINPHGQFIGLKSKFVKRSTEYEIYTRIRGYLPWIKSMVGLHGSW